MGNKVSCHVQSGEPQHMGTNLSTTSRDQTIDSACTTSKIGKSTQPRSGNTSHSDGVTTHSSTLPYRQAGSDSNSLVMNPLDPSHDTLYPIDERPKASLAMHDVAVLAAPKAPNRLELHAPSLSAAAAKSAVPPVAPVPCATSPVLRQPRGSNAQRTLAGTAAAAAAATNTSGSIQTLGNSDSAEINASHSRLDISGPFLNPTRRESSLTDITMDDDISSSMHASISGNLRHSTGGGFPYRGEDLDLQRQQAPLSIEEDLFIYDDIVISKDEARTKHWRLAGRKPALQLDAIATTGKSGEGSSSGGSPSAVAAAAAAAKRLSTSGSHKFFSFNDFDVCVDEMDFSLARPAAGQEAAVNPPAMDGIPTSPITPSHALGDDEMNTLASLGSGACGASFYAKLSDRVSVMSTVPSVRNTGSALDTRTYEASSKSGRVLKDFTYDTIIGHATRVKCIALCPNERDYASCSNEDASITLCNLGVRDEVGIFTGHIDTVINATFSPDGKYLATTSKDKTMILWDVMTTKKILTFSHAKVVICCCFAPDSKYLVSGCQDRVCRLWDTRRGKEWLSYTQHDGIIIAIAFSPDGNYVCSASADKTLRVWSTSTAKTRFTLSGHTGIILACSYTNDGKHIISNDETSLRVWNTDDGGCTLSLSPAQVAGSTHLTAKGPKLGWTLSCAAPGAFTNYALVACNNRFVYVVDLNTGKEVHAVFCKAPVYCLAAGTKDLTACGDSFGNIYILRLE